jgi:hypothetical protein
LFYKGNNMTHDTEKMANGRADLRDEVAGIVRDGKDVAKRITSVIHRAIAEGSGTLVGLPGILAGVVEGALKGVVNCAPGEQRERLEGVLVQLEEVFVSILTAIQLTIKEAAARGERVAGEEVRDFASELFSLAQLFSEIVSQYAGQFGSEARIQASDLRLHFGRIAMKMAPLVQALMQAAVEIPQAVALQAASTTSSWLASALRKAADKLDKERDESSKGASSAV